MTESVRGRTGQTMYKLDALFLYDTADDLALNVQRFGADGQRLRHLVFFLVQPFLHQVLHKTKKNCQPVFPICRKDSQKRRLNNPEYMWA